MSEKENITKMLLLEMNSLCKRNGTTLVIVLLKEDRTNKYKKFAIENGIQFVNCVPGDMPNSGLTVKGEGHPNGLMNSYWARCITDYIRKKGVIGNNLP